MSDTRRDADTIFALATAMPTLTCGSAASRALIRISGPAIGDKIAHLIAPFPQQRAACAARLTLDGGTQLPILLMRGIGPATFTGDDTLEILLPANPWLVQRVLTLLASSPGLRKAQPGEFSARAYLSGKMSLDEAQHVGALIAATRDEELDAARLVLTKEPGQRASAWAQEIAEILALIEAGIDFSDQDDVVAIDIASRSTRIQSLIDRISGEVGVGSAQLQTGLPRIVLWGAPNSGKSTLFNALLGRPRAVASPIAGTTRDVLVEELDLDSSGGSGGNGGRWSVSRATLMDLAGICEADPREFTPESTIDQAAQDAAHRALATADIILWCDPSSHFDTAILPASAAHARRVLHIRTMADIPRLNAPQVADLSVCGLDGWNLDQLIHAVRDALAATDVSTPGMNTAREAAAIALIPRHRAAVESTQRHLHAALNHAPFDELCASALRQALSTLGEMTGEISPDEVLSRVFARFCIGK